MQRGSRLAAVTLAALLFWVVPALAQGLPPSDPPPVQRAPGPDMYGGPPGPNYGPPPGPGYGPPPGQGYGPPPGQGYGPPPGQGYGAGPGPNYGPPPGPNGYGPDELVSEGHRFFGNVSRGLASVIERAVSQWGLPNGYVLGEEGSGAFVAGLRYGEGTLYTKNAGDLRVYWQGPSVGFDWGGDGARSMTLVYNLPSTAAIYQRFVGIDGSAYIIGGFGMNALTANGIVLVPIRSGIGLRLGANVGYLKYTPQATWNPF